HTTAGKLAQFDSYNQTLAPAIVQATAKLRVGHYVTKPVKTVMATADTKDKPTYEIINVVSRRSKTAAVTDDSGKQIDVT
ncbi:foldase, partial [Streptococcus thermophilus]|nr:foldase [Streptococcus thermophilus]